MIIADGGSTDSTLRIISEIGNARVVRNQLRTGEAGKALGVKWAENDILAFIDSDNVLDDPLWLRRMTAPFSNPKIVASEPLYFSHRQSDPLITRYCALIGANDPLTVYLGNHDKFCHFKRTWTEIPLRQEDYGDYLSVELKGKMLPTFGANGFLVRKLPFLQARPESFLFDVDLVQDLAEMGRFRLAKVKVGITHLFAPNIGLFFKKSFRRIRDYLFYSNLGARTYRWNDYPRTRLLKFLLFSMTVIPTLHDARRGYKVFPDRAWLFHPIGCLVVLLTYTIMLIASPRRMLRVLARGSI